MAWIGEVSLGVGFEVSKTYASLYLSHSASAPLSLSVSDSVSACRNEYAALTLLQHHACHASCHAPCHDDNKANPLKL